MNSNKKNILDESVQYVKSVGPKRAESFAKIGIHTIRDLLFYFPSRYLDRTTVVTAAKAYGYTMNGFDGELTVLGKVIDTEKRRFGKKEILKVNFKNSTGFFECVWFQAVKYFYSVFKEGDIFAISAKPAISKYGSLQFVHPDFDRLTDDEETNFLHTGKIIPFYRIPKELKATNIGDLSLRSIINNAVQKYADKVEESLPEEIIQNNALPNINSALKSIHFPETDEQLSAAQNRFKFEELFYLEILVALRKYNYGEKLTGNKMQIKTELVSEFIKTLPFQLTKSQLKVLSEIKNDMLSGKPMNRLLQGDVGSGKTIVALIAMLIAIDNGYQAALMAPTEILADQHAIRTKKLLEKINLKLEKPVNVNLILGGQKKSEREKILKEIETESPNIIIGTHAIFEEKVKFNNLGLVIIDEQHRFGVRQRAKLQSKATVPDVLVMSATPIPRTLSMTVYGDLDVSIIDEMPKSRIPVKTALRGESKIESIYKFIVDKTKEGYQSFIVYPLVEESEALELKAATTFYEQLKNSNLKGLRLGLIHGKMKWQEKEKVMLKFLQKEFDVLISTTVIEVGIDIPDANIILINDAHRFGLSQLHQLRGRVGRSNKQAYCILVTNDELVSNTSAGRFNLKFAPSKIVEKHKTALRLNTMVETNDGFKIAEADLKLRGPGDIFGTKQSGLPDLKFADIVSDTKLIAKAKKIAFGLIKKDPALKLPENKIIKNNLTIHYSESLKYATIA